jgi:hypothetical protein
MVIDNLHIVSIPLLPPETYPPTIIDPDAVLPLPVSLQSLQMVRGRNSQILQRLRSIEHSQFAKSRTLKVRPESSHGAATEKSLELSGLKGSDHRSIL